MRVSAEGIDMGMMEIILLAAGGVIFVLSFFIPDRKGASGGLSQDDVRKLLEQELPKLRDRADEAAEESAASAMEKTERSLERLSNEKIMAVSEYSDTVLKEIHKSHEEVMFLYDMLNNKHASLKNAVADVSRAVKEAEEAASSLRRLLQERTLQPERAELPRRAEAPVSVERAAEPKKGERKDVPGKDGREGAGETAEQSKREQIMPLYRQGYHAAAIARELGLGIGEVKLIIDLYRNQ